MPYRKRTSMARRLASMRAARLRQIEEGPAPEYPPALPELRREVIVRDHDAGLVEYHFKLFRTRRRDCYRLECDGKILARRIGWSRALAMIRKGFLRVGPV